MDDDFDSEMWEDFGGGEGVFDESALGGDPIETLPSMPPIESGPSSTFMPSTYPAYPSGVSVPPPITASPLENKEGTKKLYRKIGPNRYEVYENTPQVITGPVYTKPVAGMGSLGLLTDTQRQINDALGTQTWYPTASPDKSGVTTGTNTQDRSASIIGGVTAGIAGALGITNSIYNMVQDSRTQEAQRTAASQELDMRMQLFQQQIAQTRAGGGDVAQLLAALQQAQAAQARGNPEQGLSYIPEQPSSPWPWIVGGIAVVGLGGLIVYLVTRKS